MTIVGKDVITGVGTFVGTFTTFCATGCATGCPTVIDTSVSPGEAAKLVEMALVVAVLDNDDVMVAPETEGGAMTMYLTETPTTVGAACRLISVVVNRREDVGQSLVVPSLYRHEMVIVPSTQLAGKLAVSAAAMLLVKAVMAAGVVTPMKD